ncbi:hypothetical protein FG386_003401 [Cryptosporidium ryanae]|uniref:uncharacterized protein n=1 Tax=Cryptosporidium ryanae TaxID=515981 RepID=UPI00351AA1A6|nr:hypothetical protein FG386_003401 [Cryptosporidium ryanae]
MFSYCSNITERVLYSTIKDVMNNVFTGFEKEQLSASLLSGNFEIRNLNIRRGLFENISFPISLNHGLVGKVNINIIWRKIFTQEFVKIGVEDVYLIFNMIDMKKWDVEMFEKNWINIKSNLLKQDEFMMFLKSSIASNFMKQLGNFFISKIQIEIKNINFRIENVVKKYMNTFVIGLSIENISSQNCNEYWIPLDNEKGDVHERIQSYRHNHNNKANKCENESFSTKNGILYNYLNKNTKDSSSMSDDEVTELDIDSIMSIVNNNFNNLIFGKNLGGDINKKEFDFIMNEIINKSRSVCDMGDKSKSKINFWSKLRDNTPLKWVWSNINHIKNNESINSIQDKNSNSKFGISDSQIDNTCDLSGFCKDKNDKNSLDNNQTNNIGNYNDHNLIYPYPNKFGLIKKIIDKYILLKESKEIHRYKKDKLVNANILEDNEVYLKSFKVINFSIYVDNLNNLDSVIENSTSAWSTLIIEKSDSEKIEFLNDMSLKELSIHNYIINPHRLELRLRLSPKILNYDDNLFASALNDRFYVLNQDKDNEVIPLISSYLVIDSLNLNINYKQIRILLEFIDYSIFLYGDFEAGSCPIDYHNYPDENTKKTYRLSWLEFLIGNRDRNYHLIRDIENKYNVYSLIKLRNDVFKCLNYSIYYTLRYNSIIKLDYVPDCDLDNFNPPIENNSASSESSNHEFFDLMEFSLDSNLKSHNFIEGHKKNHIKNIEISDDEKINNSLFQFVLSRIVIGQNEHYFDSFNIGEEARTRQSEIRIDDKEKEMISSNDIIGKAIENAKILLSNNKIPVYINLFNINSYLKKENSKKNQIIYHTCLFSLTFNILNLSLNYSIDFKNITAKTDSLSAIESGESEIFERRNIRLNCMDLFFQYKHFMESKKSEITVALENSFIVVENNNQDSFNSKCLLRIGPNIQGKKYCKQGDDFEYLIFHPILHRTSIHTGTSICNKRPYRMHVNNNCEFNNLDNEICDHIGGFWFTIGLNGNLFRKSPRISVNGKTFGEISLMGSYDVLGSFLDPIINHLSPKQRNTYLNKASKNIIKVIKKGQQLVNEYFADNNFDFCDIEEKDSYVCKKSFPNYIYVNVDVSAKQCLFLPILTNTQLKEHESQNIYNEFNKNLLSNDGVYCIDFGEMEIKVGDTNDIKKDICGTKSNYDKQNKTKFYMDNIKVFVSNISLTYLTNVRESDLYIFNYNINNEVKNVDKNILNVDNLGLSECNARHILKPQDWIFNVVKHFMYNSTNKCNDKDLKEYVLGLEFYLDLKENTCVEIDVTDLDLHNIIEIINYFMEFYAKYNIINYSEILISNNSGEEQYVNIYQDEADGICNKNRNTGEINYSNINGFTNLRKYGNSRDNCLTLNSTSYETEQITFGRPENIRFSSTIEFISKVHEVKITINSDKKYREMIGMTIKDLSCVRLMINSIELLYNKGENDSDSCINISIGDVCLSGGILNRNSHLMMPLVYPISDNVCNITVKFSDLKNIDRYKNFTGILLSNSYIDVQINSPRFIVYWELYGIILNWVITFYFKSIAVYLVKKIDIDNIKSIFVDKNLINSGKRLSSSSIKTDDRELNDYECSTKEHKKGGKVGLSKSDIIQLLSILNLNIHFRNVTAILPCTLPDAIQMVITEKQSYSNNNTSSSSSASAYSQHSVPISASGTGAGSDKNDFSETGSFFKIDILKSLLAVIESDIIYSFSGESIFEIENKTNSTSKLKYNSSKSSFEMLKGNIQFGRSVTPRFIMDQFNSISLSGAHLNNPNTYYDQNREILRTKFVKSFDILGNSSFDNLKHTESNNNFTIKKNSESLSVGGKSELRKNNTVHDFSFDNLRDKIQDNYHEKGNWYHTNTLKSYYLPKTPQNMCVIVELERIINSYLWGFNIDYINTNDYNIVSSLRLKIDYIYHQFNELNAIENCVARDNTNFDNSTCLLYVFLENFEIKANTNDLLHLINIFDTYYNMVQNKFFLDLAENSINSYFGSSNLDFQDSNIDLNSENSSKYNVGFNYQVNANNKNTSMLNYLLYLFPSIFYSNITSYKKFISQFKVEGIKIHYIPTNLFSNKDGVLIDISNSQLGIFINNESPDVSFLFDSFPFLNHTNDNFGLLFDEYEIKEKELMVPYFSINSIPILPIIPKSKDIFFGVIIEFNKMSVNIYNNKFMFYDNFIEPFDISVISVCKGENINIKEITKEKVIPVCKIDISWINLTLTPEYVRYWVNCLDNFNEVYSIYYKKLGNTNNLISKQLFLYNEILNSMLIEGEGDLNSKMIISRPVSVEYEQYIHSNCISNHRDYLGNVGPKHSATTVGAFAGSLLRTSSGDYKRINDSGMNGSNFIFYNDTGQTIAILMPYFISNNKLNKIRGNSKTINREFSKEKNLSEGYGKKRISHLKSYKENIFDKLLIRKKSLLNNNSLNSQDSELSNISKVAYNLNYVWRYIKPNKKIFLSRDEYGNIYPVIIRIRILDEIFDIHNVKMDKVNMESIYLTICEENNIKIPLLIRTDIMDNNSFLISISSRIYISNKTSNILRFLPNFKSVEQFLNSNYFIPPINDTPIAIPKYNNIYYETSYRKYIDHNYILSVLDFEITRKGDLYDYINVFINLNNLNKNVSIDMFTLYLNPNTYTCMPLWTCIPVFSEINKKRETKCYPLKVVLNNIWLETLNNNSNKNYNIKIEQYNTEDNESLIKEILSYSKSLGNQYKRVYIDLINLSRVITPLKSYKLLLSPKTIKRSKNSFESITIKLKKKILDNNDFNSNNFVSLCSSICDYTLNNSKNSFPLYVIKFEVPLIITNNLLIPIQISFNKNKYKVNTSLEKISEIELDSLKINCENEYNRNNNGIEFNEALYNSGNYEKNKEKKDESNFNHLLEQIITLNYQNQSYIRVNSNERIFVESFPNNMNLSLLDVSFNKFFGFYKSSQIPIYYNSSGKEIDKDLVVPLKFYNGYKLLPKNQIGRINGLSTVLVNEFLPNSTCINLTFEKNKTSYVSKDLIPRQKQDYTYYMDNLLNISSNIDVLDNIENLDNYAIPTPWNGYICHKYNTCKMRISIHASLWINNRQNIPIYILQNSGLSSRYRVGSNEFRILPTSNGKTDISIALTPELSKKCHSQYFHIERPNVIGTITVPSKKSSNLVKVGGNNGIISADLHSNKDTNENNVSNGNQIGLFKDLFSTNVGLKLSYCVTTINNLSNSPNFMVNLYNKYTIVNYHNLPFWVREYKKMSHWVYIPPNISIPFHPATSKDNSEVEITFLDPKVVYEYKLKYNIDLNNIIQYKTLPLSIDKLCDIQIRLVSSIDNIPTEYGDNNNNTFEFNNIGNLHFNYVLSSISIYSINSSTSYQINVYPSQIPDFSIVNETPCNIFIRQINTELWNNINPVSDSNYALVDPFGEHILEMVIGVNSNSIDNTKSIKTKKYHKIENFHSNEYLIFNDYHKIPSYLYGNYKINVWYKTKSTFNLNKVLSHSKLYIPEHKKTIYFVVLIENGTRVINISFDGTLYKRRRNEIRSNYVNNTNNKNVLNLNRVDNCDINSEHDIKYENNGNNDHFNKNEKSIIKTIGDKLKSTKKNKHKLKKIMDMDNEVEFKYNDIYDNQVIDNYESMNRNENTFERSQQNSEIDLQRITSDNNPENDTFHKNSFVSSFETDLSQMSNSNLSRISSGQNIFLLVDKVRPETKISFELKINCDGLGISFLSNSNKEITYMSFQKMNLTIEKSLYNLDQFHIRFRIMEFQLDNHITSSAENTIIRKATPNEFLRLSKLKSEKKKSYYSQLIKKTSDLYYGTYKVAGECENNEKLDNILNFENYYGMESLFSVGVLTLGEGTKKKTEIIRIHNKLLNYMKFGSELNNEPKLREQNIKETLCMESFLDIQYSIILDNNNGISNKYGSNGVIEMPYLYFWIYPLSIHLDIDTLKEMVSILDLLINRILSPTEELETTKTEIQTLPLIENLKSASKYVYIQILLMNPIQILCSTSKSTWNISSNQGNNYIDCYNVMNNITKLKENEIIIKKIIECNSDNNLRNNNTTINYRIVNHSSVPNLNNQVYIDQERVKNNSEISNYNKNDILVSINDEKINNSDINNGENNIKNKSETNNDQIQSNLTLNKTGTELILNILQWLSTMPFSNVPIEFKGVVNESIFMDGEKCMNQIGDLYKQQIYSHIGKIIGSIDLLGNPIDIYILLKEGLLASRYHFDLFKRANRLKERINKNMERKIIKNKDIDHSKTSKIDNVVFDYINHKSNNTNILNFESSNQNSNIDEEADRFIRENKSLLLKYNAELMSKIVLFSIKEIFFGLQILIGTWIAIISQFVARMTSAAIHLLEVCYLLDQDSSMGYWYGTPLYVSRYLADNPKNLIDGLHKGLLRSFLILLSIVINFWNIPRGMKRQYGITGIFLGVLTSILRILPAGFAAFISIFYGISSGIVQSLRTKIEIKHIRKLRIVYGDSPILPYNPNQSIANTTLNSLKLLNNLKESKVITYIPFQTIENNIDNIIINRNNGEFINDNTLAKKFLIYNLLASNDDTSIKKYNGLIILKDCISLLKSGKIMWLIPLINITRINLYLVVNKVNSEEKSKRINIKNIFFNDGNKNNINDANFIDAKSHIFDIIRNDVHTNLIHDYNSKKTFEFHLFVKPDNTTQNKNVKSKFNLFTGTNNLNTLKATNETSNYRSETLNKNHKITNLFSNKKYIRQFLLPKKINDVQVNKRLIINNNKINIKTNNKTLNGIFNKEIINQSSSDKLKNSKSYSVIDSYFRRSSIISFRSSLSFSNQFPMSSYKLFTEKIIFSVQSECDALNIFSILSKYINSE